MEAAEIAEKTVEVLPDMPMRDALEPSLGVQPRFDFGSGSLVDDFVMLVPMTVAEMRVGLMEFGKSGRNSVGSAWL